MDTLAVGAQRKLFFPVALQFVVARFFLCCEEVPNAAVPEFFQPAHGFRLLPKAVGAILTPHFYQFP